MKDAIGKAEYIVGGDWGLWGGSGYPQGFIVCENDASEYVRSPWDKIQELEELIEYHSYYFGYLLGQYTEEEFKEIALTFVGK